MNELCIRIILIINKMGFVFWPKKKKEKLIILDVGTEAVKTLIFEKEGERSVLLKASLEYFDDLAFSLDEDKVSQAIKESLSVNIQNTAVNNVLLGLPPDILKSGIVRQSISREKDKGLINVKEADAITDGVLKKAKIEIAERVALKIGILPKDIHFIALNIFDKKIDGYEVPAIPGYSGKNLTFSILAVFMPQDYFDKIEKALKDFKINKFRILHLAEGFLNASFLGAENSAFVDIGGESTHLFLTKNNKLFDIEEWTIGGRNFSSYLSGVLGISAKDARLLKERYSKRLLSLEVKDRISEILVYIQKEWYKNLENKIGEKILPSVYYFFGGGSLLFGMEGVLGDGRQTADRLLGGSNVKLFCPKDLSSSLQPKEEQLFNFVINSPQYTPSFLLYYVGKNS